MIIIKAKESTTRAKMMSKLMSKGVVLKPSLFVYRDIRRGILSEAVQIELGKALVALGTLSSIFVFTQYSSNKRFEDFQKGADKRAEDFHKASEKRAEYFHKTSDKRAEDFHKTSDKRAEDFQKASDKRFADLIGSLKDGKASDALVKTAEASVLDVRFKTIETKLL